MDFDYTDHGREAVVALLSARGIETFEIVDRAPVLGRPDVDEAILVRIPDAAPEVLLVKGRARERERPSSVVAFLEEALGSYDHATRRTRDLLKRHANERDRAGIERVLRSLAAGETTRESAAEALGLGSVIDLVKLEFEFGIKGTPRMVDIAEDMMHDFDEMDAEDDKVRKSGEIPRRDWLTIESYRRGGTDDATIRQLLNLAPDLVLPTPEEIDAYTDSLVYGIEPGDPPAGLTLTVTVGTKAARIAIRATDGVEEVKVAFPRWAGRNAGGYIDAHLDRLALDGNCPVVEGWTPGEPRPRMRD